MKLTLNRIRMNSDYTIGKLYLDGRFECFTLEDAVRATKIAGRTAIPVGEYGITMNLSNRFKRVLPLLLSVPNFTGIRIHDGNTASDTDGCILVGKFDRGSYIAQSDKALEELLVKMLANKDNLSIKVS